MESFLKSLGFDRYERQARLKPALLTVLPVLVMAAIWLPAVWGVFGGIATLVAGCGLTFLLSKLARYCGRALEQKLVATRGGQYTTLFLRHRDPTISPASKASYHALLSKKRGRLPTPEEEVASPAQADELYRGAVDWLLEATRDDKRHGLVKDENIDYGFRRNLLGLKPVGVTLTLACLVIDAWLAWTTYGVDENRFWTAVVLGLALVGGLMAWTFWVRRPFVEDAARSYAKRLLAQCDVLGNAAPAKRRAKAKA